MVEIEITRKGVYGSDGKRLPVGTRVKMEKEPKGWANKYRLVGGNKAAAPTPATPTPPNPGDAWGKKDGESEVDKLRARYKELAGKDAPEHYKEPGLRKAIEELEKQPK